MSDKANQFTEYLKSNDILNLFLIEKLSDEKNTSIFISNIKINQTILLKYFISFDNSQNILIQVAMWESVNFSEQQADCIYDLVNELNNLYPLFKFFYQDKNRVIFLEMMHVAHDDLFEPKVLHSFLTWIANLANDIYKRIDKTLK